MQVWKTVAVAVLGVVLAGCEGTFTGDVAADAPADPALETVHADLLGLEFRRAGGGTRTLEFTAPERVEWLALAEGAPLRLFTDEPLAEATYSGVRLLFADDPDGVVVDESGAEFALSVEDGDYAELDFTIAEDERDSHAWVLTLDLRRSLVFVDANEGYTLTPALRAVRRDRAAAVAGRVEFDCPGGEALERVGAVYLFEGAAVTPDDLDGDGVEPVATARVRIEDAGSDPVFAIRNVEPGDYTLALTCQGDEDVPGTDDALTFSRVRSARLVAGETVERDLD